MHMKAAKNAEWAWSTRVGANDCHPVASNQEGLGAVPMVCEESREEGHHQGAQQQGTVDHVDCHQV